MSLAFIHRPPTASEVERLRLILSTFQDGSGMVKNGSATLPGWRDFERAVSLIFEGEAPENKALFDVLLKDRSEPLVRYGLSCKMRSELNRVIRPQRDGRATIEESNSAGEFKDAIRARGIGETEYRTRAQEVGKVIVDVIEQRKERARRNNGLRVDIDNSCYVVLLWNRKGLYQLFQFSLDLPKADSLNWYYSTEDSRHINGDNSSGGRVFEWYPDSGGQLKYYPHPDNAIWKSDTFTLEPIGEVQGYALAEKAAAYFPDAWSKTAER